MWEPLPGGLAGAKQGGAQVGMSYGPYSFSALLLLSTSGRDYRTVAKEHPSFVLWNVRMQEDKRGLLDIVEVHRINPKCLQVM